jgi:hypothetical protein
MKRFLGACLLVLFTLALALPAEARRVRVVRHPHRTTVIVHRGFPIHRVLPAVVVRTPGFAVRVAPRVFLPPVVFGATVVAALPAPGVRVWRQAEVLERDDEWTELNMDVDRRGSQLLLQVDRGAAQVSFAEVVFDNGEAQVVDFNDRVHRQGIYNLLDFKDGRKVDHVRVVAKADSPRSEISLHLVS